MHITAQWLLHYFAIFYYPSIQNRNTSYLTYASIQVYTTLCSMMTDGRMSVSFLPVATFIDNCVNVLWEFNFDEPRPYRCPLRCAAQWESFSLRCPVRKFTTMPVWEFVLPRVEILLLWRSRPMLSWRCRSLPLSSLPIDLFREYGPRRFNYTAGAGNTIYSFRQAFAEIFIGNLSWLPLTISTRC